MIERAHYAAQLLWVLGNMVWALGEFYFASYDEAFSMGERNYEARRTPRWWASWVLCSAYFPIFLLYIMWIPLTLSGRLAREEDRGDTINDIDVHDGMGINMNVIVSNPIVALAGCVLDEDHDNRTFSPVRTDIVEEDTDSETMGRGHNFNGIDSNENSLDGFGSYSIVIGDDKPSLHVEVDGKKSPRLPMTPVYNVIFDNKISSELSSSPVTIRIDKTEIT